MTPMRHASFASGIGGFDLGFERAGMESVFQCELDPFCLRVLATHWPDVPKHGDLRTLEASTIPEAELWSTGFPCQDLSVAGKRGGLHGARSGLWFDFARLVESCRPEWLVVENVAGLLSSNGGADMALIVGQLSSIGYGVAWRVLDSQFFGVPQRRRRVYIVGHLGDLRAFEVLFEREGGGGDSPQGGGEAKDVAYTLAGSPRGTGDGHGNAWNTTYALTARGPGERLEREAPYITYRKRTMEHGKDAGDESWEQSEQADVLTVDQRPTTIVAGLRASDGHHGHSSPRGDGGDNRLHPQEERTDALQANQTIAVSTSADPEGVREAPGIPRRLDSPRYRALGNAVTVNVTEWIGKRIVDAATRATESGV